MKKLHIIPHTHWDREWYMPFEQHRYRLVELMDDLLEVMKNDKEYKYFHMDGQVIPILDYLEVKPSRKDEVLKLIALDKIQIGPWYILQDEYLISSEANVRNMLIGLKLSKSLGAKPVMTGYFPDSFGNISQAPQILKKFGIETAVFGRGLNEVGFNNEIISQKGINKSEVNWQSPDGSTVACVMFANWYCNAIDLPLSGKENTERFQKIIDNTQKFSHLDDLLGMNGCDHTPIQKDLTSALNHARKTIPDVEIIHSNMKDYLDIVLKHKNRYGLVQGEIAGQLTRGYHLLINTASSRVDLKKLNHQAQVTLEKRAEPIAAIAHHYGIRHDSEYFDYAWKLLMENHPHDSICSCSVDPVHDEMTTRFNKVIQVADLIEAEAARKYLSQLDTTSFKGKVLAVFNPYPFKVTKPIKAHVDFLVGEGVKAIELLDCYGQKLEVTYSLLENQFTYELPKDRFRQVHYVDHFEVEFIAHDLNPLGFTLFDVVPTNSGLIENNQTDDRIMENEFIRVTINLDGSFNIYDKLTHGYQFNLNTFEYTLDIGNEYNYEQSIDRFKLLTNNQKAEIRLILENKLKKVYQIKHVLKVPKGVENQKRSLDTVKTEMISTYTLYQNSKSVDIETTITNQAENFRIRALFPNKINTKKVDADGQFDIVERDIMPWEGWENPSNTQRFQAFVQLKDDEQGLQVAAQGLLEYEVLRFDDNTLALTLLRGTGELGDWGIFPTPKSQMKGTHKLAYQVTLFEPKDTYQVARLGYIYNGLDLKTYQTSSHQTGPLKAESFASYEESRIHMSAFKKAEYEDAHILRLYNISPKKVALKLKINKDYKQVYLATLGEEEIKLLEMKDHQVVLNFGPKEIHTLKFKS